MNPRPPERNFPPRCPMCKKFLCDVASPHCDWKTNHQCAWMSCKCGAIIRQDGKAVALRDGKWVGVQP